MARSTRGNRRFSSHARSTPYPLPSYHHGTREKDGKTKRNSKAIRKDWEDATCSVCMEFPHNAVLLLCSSHDKGCRPYMCGTSYRYSNCLDQFKKAYTKMEIQSDGLTEKPGATDLLCPLCRGEVKGWTVVEPAREYLNTKKRSCTHDNCSFAGTYKELRKHVRAEHPTAKPHEVDPMLEQKWRRLEHERDREDAISTIRTSMPGAMVFGDYVIENNGGYDSFGEDGLGVEHGYGGRTDDNWSSLLFLLQTLGNSRHANFASRLRRSQRGYRVFDGEGAGGGRIPISSSSSTGFPLFDEAEDFQGDDVEEDDDNGDLVIRQGHDAQRISRRRRRRRIRSRSEIDFP